jgi:hypothetical protein
MIHCLLIASLSSSREDSGRCSCAAQTGPELLRCRDQSGCGGGSELVPRLCLHLVDERVELSAVAPMIRSVVR